MKQTIEKSRVEFKHLRDEEALQGKRCSMICKDEDFDHVNSDQEDLKTEV